MLKRAFQVLLVAILMTAPSLAANDPFIGKMETQSLQE